MEAAEGEDTELDGLSPRSISPRSTTRSPGIASQPLKGRQWSEVPRGSGAETIATATKSCRFEAHDEASPRPERRRSPRISRDMWPEIRRRTHTDDGLFVGEDASRAYNASGRYRAICRKMNMPTKPLVCKALQALDAHGEALPPEFSTQCYLGNREARAFFLALGYCPWLDDARVSEGREQVGNKLLESLLRLDLAGQGIADEAAAALAELLPRCRRLLVLDIRWNQISARGAFQLVRTIENHQSVREVRLDGNPTPSWLRVRMAKFLERRRRG